MSKNDPSNGSIRLGAHVVVALLGVVVAWGTSTPGASAQDCFPPCRTGFTCQAGACVSSCDPPCGPGQTCNSMGACEPPAGAVAPPGGGGGLTPPGGGGGGAPLWGPGAQPGGPPPGGAPQSPSPAGGAPAWGPGSAGAGQQVWSPETAPPTPLTDEEIERRAIRTRFRFVLYGLVGAFDAEYNSSNTRSLQNANTDMGFGGGFGLGFRANFTRAFGIQARFLTTFDTAPLTLTGNSWSPPLVDWDVETMAIDAVLDAGIRLGPVSDDVPWYFGVLFGAGMHLLMGDALCHAESDSYYCNDPFESSERRMDGDVVDLGSDYFMFNMGAETGFIFGGSEQFDLGFRAAWLTDWDGLGHQSFTVFFGLALL